MEQLISYCGLLCNECSAYIATANDDDVLRQKTAAEWRKTYGGEFKAEDINCLGCQSGVLFGHCNVCAIRACGVAKTVSNCAGCDEFGCDKIAGFWEQVPEAKDRLEKLRLK